MVSIGFADHVGRVLFTVCVDDRQPPPKTFFDPGKTLVMLNKCSFDPLKSSTLYSNSILSTCFLFYLKKKEQEHSIFYSFSILFYSTFFMCSFYLL